MFYVCVQIFNGMDENFLDEELALARVGTCLKLKKKMVWVGPENRNIGFLCFRI